MRRVPLWAVVDSRKRNAFESARAMQPSRTSLTFAVARRYIRPLPRSRRYQLPDAAAFLGAGTLHI